MFCPIAGWCFVLNMRKLVHWEGALFSQILLTAVGVHFAAVKSKWTFLPLKLLLKPGRVSVMCDIGFLHEFAFNSCSSLKSLVLHSGMFVHSFMAVVTTFQTNKLYPLLQLDSCNGEEKCSLINWFPSSFCGSQWDFFLTLRENRAESPSHNSSAAWLCLVHSWGEKGWTPLLNSSSI